MAKSYRRSSISYDDDLEQYYHNEYKYKKKQDSIRKRRKVNYNNVNDIMSSLDEEYEDLQQK